MTLPLIYVLRQCTAQEKDKPKNCYSSPVRKVLKTRHKEILSLSKI